MMDILQLSGGLALLLVGGYALVRGASALAASFGVSPVVVGLTVVAFGTSAPELAVNSMAATKGLGAISFGNVIGSNLANLGLILGLTALFRPLPIEGRIVVREIPMMLLATGLVVVDRPRTAARTRLGVVLPLGRGGPPARLLRVPLLRRRRRGAQAALGSDRGAGGGGRRRRKTEGGAGDSTPSSPCSASSASTSEAS